MCKDDFDKTGEFHSIFLQKDFRKKIYENITLA
jgi:hypothetical protein